MPPTALATTGRSFHIASATVRPKPSARLFWTTTVACRWSALTIAAFSSGSSIGMHARWTRLRACVRAAAPQRSMHSSQHVAALGVVGDAGRRPGRRARGARRARGRRGAAKAFITPAMSFMPVPARDLDDERRVGRRRRPGLQRRRHGRLMRPGEPSRRVNGDGAAASTVAVEQADVGERSAARLRVDIGSFLAENGSIDGGITCTLRADPPTAARTPRARRRSRRRPRRRGAGTPTRAPSTRWAVAARRGSARRPCAGALQRRDEPGRLRVVEERRRRRGRTIAQQLVARCRAATALVVAPLGRRRAGRRRRAMP